MGFLCGGVATMSKSYKKDLTGQRFGKLTVLEFVQTTDEESHWRCRCDCGNIAVIRIGGLTSGKTQSCGCLQKERASQAKKKHGMTHTRLYNIWKSMKERCYNRNAVNYNRYGGRGITICKEWQNNFQAFATWAQNNGYNDSLTIDRIDNYKEYSPDNCRWCDVQTQSKNRRSNVIVEYKGKKMCLKDAAKLSKIAYKVLWERYQYGDKGERLFRPIDAKNRRNNIIIEYNGKKMCLKDAAKLSKIAYSTLFGRYSRGDRGERLFRP